MDIDDSSGVAGLMIFIDSLFDSTIIGSHSNLVIIGLIPGKHIFFIEDVDVAGIECVHALTSSPELSTML
jgi:hypothetical protein